MRYTEELVLRILDKIRHDTSKTGDVYLNQIEYQRPAVLVTCPYHGMHREMHPSCGVFIEDRESFHIGDFHCFQCGQTGNFIKLIADCLNEEQEETEHWLEDNADSDIYDDEVLPELKFDEKKQEEYLDDSAMARFDGVTCQYMWDRKLTPEVASKFHIGYDHINDAIAFPVWDELGRLKFITARSVKTKRFYIPKSAEKPVYLLNYIIENGISNRIYVCESQINTLTCYVYGKNAVGLFGTGSRQQIATLNKSGIRHVILALDPDNAGMAGTRKLINNLSKNILIDVMILPLGRDINDLTKEEFDACEIIDSSEWLERNKIKEKKYF